MVRYSSSLSAARQPIDIGNVTAYGGLVLVGNMQAVLCP